MILVKFLRLSRLAPGDLVPARPATARLRSRIAHRRRASRRLTGILGRLSRCDGFCRVLPRLAMAFGVAVAATAGWGQRMGRAAETAAGAAGVQGDAAVERREPPPGFVSLFNGRDLSGWVQHGGRAIYGVEEGAIVGRTVAGTPNSFLCTTRAYTNFVFQFEFEIRAGMNSGVQFRSLVTNVPTTVEVNGVGRKIPAGRVHGYQYELDPSPRAFTAGVYDEGCRGWLADLKDKPEARAAFRPGVWNAGRIECRGEQIRTWINGVPAVELRDGLTPAGFIALQVHGIGTNRVPGEIVRWRRLWIQELP